MTPEEWNEIVETVKGSRLDDWHAYECENEVQSLTRLARQIGRHEVQLNRIRHSAGPHCHGCEMTSLVLMVGYGFWLRQYPAEADRYQFAAPGSLITMGPNDTHWIPAQTVPSLSLCAFANQTDWHLHYLPARLEVANQILADAKFALFNQVPVPELKVSA